MPFEAYYWQMKGAPPDSELWRLAILLKEQASNFQRTLNLPPGCPPEALDALRAAMAAILSDEEYRADALKTIKFVPRFTQGPAVEKVYLDSMRVDEKLRAFLQAYAEEGVKMVGK